MAVLRNRYPDTRIPKYPSTQVPKVSYHPSRQECDVKSIPDRLEYSVMKVVASGIHHDDSRTPVDQVLYNTQMRIMGAWLTKSSLKAQK